MIEIRFAEGYEKKAIKFFKKHKNLYPQYKKTFISKSLPSIFETPQAARKAKRLPLYLDQYEIPNRT